MSRVHNSEKQTVSSVHSPFWPQDVRRGEGISAVFYPNQIVRDGNKSEGRSAGIKVNVWRISPLGCEFMIEGEHIDVPVGRQISLSMKMNNQSFDFDGLLIAERRELRNSQMIAVRWATLKKVDGNQQGRVTQRWTTSAAFLPTGMVANPIMFNDFVLYRVLDLSARGMRIVTSMRNKFILPKMMLEGSILLPTVGNAHVRFKVAWTEVTSEEGKDLLTCGVEFVDPSNEMQTLVGQYLFQFSEHATTTELLKAGLPVKSAAAGITIDYVRNEADYIEVLKLRARSYTWVTDGDESQHLVMADEFDARSRIIIARRNGKAVGSFRLVFHNVDDQLEQQKHATLPEDFPRNDELLEITRICTDPSYRGTDLFYVVAKHSLIGVLQAGRRWGVSACTDNLWPLYQKMGFRKVGVTYEIPGHGVKVHTILCDIPAIIRGIGINPIVWNLLGADIVPYITNSNLLTLTTTDKLRMACLRLLRPVARLLAKRYSLRNNKQLMAKLNAPAATHKTDGKEVRDPYQTKVDRAA